MKTYKSESTVKPQNVDRAKNCVYINTNIVEQEATDDRPKMYLYDVEEYTKEEYLEIDSKRKDILIETLKAELASTKTELANTQTEVTNTQLGTVECYNMILALMGGQ